MPIDQKDSLFAFPITIHQDAKVFRGRVSNGQELSYKLNKERGVWVQMISGSLLINKNIIDAGDAALIENELNLQFIGKSNCEFLLFDLK